MGSRSRRSGASSESFIHIGFFSLAPRRPPARWPAPIRRRAHFYVCNLRAELVAINHFNYLSFLLQPQLQQLQLLLQRAAAAKGRSRPPLVTFRLLQKLASGRNRRRARPAVRYLLQATQAPRLSCISSIAANSRRRRPARPSNNNSHNRSTRPVRPAYWSHKRTPHKGASQILFAQLGAIKMGTHRSDDVAQLRLAGRAR
jgi:hypothetical protein